MVKSHCGFFSADVEALLRAVGLSEIIESDCTDEGVSQSPSGVGGSFERGRWDVPRVALEDAHDHGDVEDKGATLSIK